MSQLIADFAHFGKINVHENELVLDSFKQSRTVHACQKLERRFGALWTRDEIKKCMSDMNNSRGGISEDDIQSPTEQMKFLNSMVQSVSSGARFRKHRKDAKKAAYRWVLIYKDRLYWKQNAAAQNQKTRSFNLAKIVAIQPGKHTSALKNASDVEDECCFSIDSKKHVTLDLSGEKEEEVQSWIVYLNAYNRHYKNLLQNALIGPLLSSVKECSSEIKDKDHFFKQLGKSFDPQWNEWMSKIGEHSQLFDDTAFEGRLVIVRLMGELDIFSLKWVPRLLEEKISGHPAIEVLVEKWKLKQLLPCYRVLTSKFHVVQSHLVNQCFKIEFLPNTKMDHIEKSIDASCFEETEYEINGEPVPYSISSVKETIRRITCRNKKLFGDVVVWTQEFAAPQDRNELIAQEVVDLVENHSVHQLLPHYRVFTSKFQVVQSLHLNLCVKIELIPNTKMDAIEENGVDDSCFKESEYKINGSLVPYSASTFKEVVRQIRCRNTVLFGDRDVWIQSFDDFRDANVREPTNEEIINFIEEHNVKRLLPCYRMMTSKFDVLHCLSLNKSFLKFNRNTKMDHIGDDQSVNDLIFEETEYKVNGICVPNSISKMDTIVSKISCQNTKLFGSKSIWTQTFSLPDAQPMKEEVIDLVENRKIKQLLSHYRVLTSTFRVVQSHLLNQCFRIEFVANTKMDYIADQDGADDSCFKETKYTFNGIPVPHTVSTSKGAIRSISCRNTKLFGVREPLIQKFPVPPIKVEEEWHVDWFGIANAVKHEMYPEMGQKIEKVLQTMKSEGVFKVDQVQDKETKQLFEALQKMKGRLQNKEIDLISEIVKRAMTSQQIYRNAFSWSDLESKDISEKWQGLSERLLFDIFCVKKAHMFSFEQQASYMFQDFLADVEKAEHFRCLGKIGASECVKREVFKQNVNNISFHPRWLFADDLFSTMQWIFAVSNFVNDLKLQRTQGQRRRHIRVYIIPQDVVSLYDTRKQLTASLSLEKNWPQLALDYTFKILESCDSVSITDRANLIDEMYATIAAESTSNGDIMILVNRRSSSGDTAGNHILQLFLFEDMAVDLRSTPFGGDVADIPDQQSRLLLFGFHFELDEVVRSWLHFGIGPRVRFYPEYLTTLIPRLFVRPNDVTAATYLKKIYDDQFKHQWAVPLDDANFNLYYKAITGDDHISNNYYRKTVEKEEEEGIKRTFGFWQYLQRRLNHQQFFSIHPSLMKDDMDSDAVWDDILEKDKNGRVFFDEQDSNLMAKLDSETALQLKLSTLRWKSIECGPTKDNALDLKDCHHFYTAIKYLKLFQENGNEVDASNLWEFNLGEIIGSFDHIISVHELLIPERRAEIQRYLAIHVACDKGDECSVLRQHANRRRNHGRRIKTKERETVDQCEKECVVMTETLNSVHSHLLHRGQALRDDTRLQRFRDAAENQTEAKEDESKESEPTMDSLNAIDFGVSVLRWIPFAERPHFSSFRDEITGNANSTITEKRFEEFLIECCEKIRKNSNFTLKEMLGLKIYTDFTADQALLRKAHWVSIALSVKKMYYFWALALYEAALYHSVPIPSDNGKTPVTLYHGVNKMFTVDAETPKYHGPFSSTTAKTVAQNFANKGAQGLFFKMNPSYVNKLKCCLGIKVEAISCHKDEREILLVDQFLPIANAKTFDNSDRALVTYLLFSVIRWSSEIRDRKGFFRQLGIRFSSDWLPFIGEHSLLLEKTTFRNRLVIVRLAKELKKFSQNWIPRLFDLKIGDEAAIICLAEKWKIKEVLPSYRILTSKFSVVHCRSLNLSFLKFNRNTKMDHIGDDEFVDDSIFDETEYKINGICVPHSISENDIIVREIQCRNTKLFGEKTIWIQKFPAPKQQSMQDEIRHLVERQKAHQLLPHYRVMTSRFQLVQSLHLDVCVTIEFMKNSQMDYIGDDDSVNDSCFEATEYRINGVSVPYNVSMVNGAVRQIQCRNRRLFAEKEVWIQVFPGPDSREPTNTEFVDYFEEHPEERLLPHYRVLTSKFRVIQSHLVNHCFNFEFIPNTKMDYIADGHDLDEQCFEETVYEVNGIPTPYTSSSVEDIVHWISCRNTNLFGNIEVWVQNFPVPLDERALFEEVIDLVEKRSVHQLLPHYRILTSQFGVTHCHSLNLSFMNLFRNTEMDYIGEIGSVEDSCFAGTEYKVNGICVPFSISEINLIVRKIECRNTKLFGDRIIWVQEFLAQQEPHQTMYDEIVNLVEDNEVKQLLPHYRVMTSEYRIEQPLRLNSPTEILFTPIAFIPNTKMDYLEVYESITDSCFEETEYKIDGISIPYNTSMVQGTVCQIQCANRKLFGEEVAWVQRFGETAADARYLTQEEVIELVEDYNLHELLPYYRVLTSKFRVVQLECQHHFFNIFRIEFIRNTKMDHIADDEKSVDDSCFEATEYRINDVRVPHTISTFKGVIHRIQCRNIDLFGNRIIWVQEFDFSSTSTHNAVELCLRLESPVGVLWTLDEISQCMVDMQNSNGALYKYDFDSRKEMTKFLNTMCKCVSSGVRFREHQNRGIRAHRWFIIEKDYLYWKENLIAQNRKTQSLHLSDIMAIRSGKQTLTLKNAADLEDGCCFSLISVNHVVLDLSGESQEEVQRWIAYLRAYARHYENEILLVDKNSDTAMVNYMLFSVKCWNSEITNKDRFFKRIGVQFDPNWIPLIGQNSQLFVESVFRYRMVFTRLVVELSIYSKDWIHSLPDEQSMEEEVINLVEKHNVKQLLPHYRVLTSRFRVVQSLRLNDCLKIEFIPNTKMDHIGDDEKSVDNSCFEDTEYEINGYSARYTVSIFIEPVYRIQCRNNRLFGDRDVWVQEFVESQDAEMEYQECLERQNALMRMHFSR